MKKFFRPIRDLVLLWMLLSCIWCLIVTANANGALSDTLGLHGQNIYGTTYQKGLFRPGINYGLKITWEKALGSGYSSVSIADDLAVTMFSDHAFDYIAAFDTRSGEEIWRKTIDTTYKGHDNSQDGPISTPLISEGIVYGLGPKGHLFALDARNGSEIWSAHLVDQYGINPPSWGFGTSPVIYGNVLIIQTGGANTVTGFDRNTGERLWTAGTDSVNYQSPIIVTMNGKDQLLCASDSYLYVLDPVSGEKLWEYKHEGGGLMGSISMVPVLVGNDKILLNYKDSEAMLLKLKERDRKIIPEVLWTSRSLAGSYAVPVYYDGYIYGYSGQSLTCVDAKTGDKVWRSRQPGEGFLILVDGHMIITTTKGSLYISRASPEGYQEIASLKLFDDLVWCLPSYSNGRVYSRSYSEIASVTISQVSRQTLPETAEDIVAPDSEFQRFVQKVKASEDKKALIDEYMAQAKQFPIIEGNNLVHFVYRGDAEDMAIAGDLPGRWDEIPMHRIPETDFYYYSSHMEPDARLNYQFVRNFDEKITDPLNPRRISFTEGGAYDDEESSWFSMPSWVAPEHLKEYEGTEQGRIENCQFESKISGGVRYFDIYLPFGYDKGEERYPVAYIHRGKLAQAWGKIPNTLDNLIGKRISPIIAVFVHEYPDNNYGEIYWDINAIRKYAQILVEELIPFIDRNYRTIASADSRANIGNGWSGATTLYSTLIYPGTFSRVSYQSALFWSFERDESEIRHLLSATERQPLMIYFEWGKYDFKSISMKWSSAERNKAIAKIFTDKGYVLAGGEINDGWGWASWRNRTDRILGMFFPLKSPTTTEEAR